MLCHRNQFVFMPSPHVCVAPLPSEDYLKVYIPNAITSILHTIVNDCCLGMTQTAITNQDNLSLTIKSFHHHNHFITVIQERHKVIFTLSLTPFLSPFG
jgi:hypothetical protein